MQKIILLLLTLFISSVHADTSDPNNIDNPKIMKFSWWPYWRSIEITGQSSYSGCIAAASIPFEILRQLHKTNLTDIPAHTENGMLALFMKQPEECFNRASIAKAMANQKGASFQIPILVNYSQAKEMVDLRALLTGQ